MRNCVSQGKKVENIVKKFVGLGKTQELSILKRYTFLYILVSRILMITTAYDVGKFIYSSFVSAREYNRNKIKDEERRNPQFTGELLRRLGHPDHKGVNILVTGSKGKGSLSIILNRILRESGYSVGLFTGPHLVSFNERIVVNDKMISDEDFIQLAKTVEPVVNEMQGSLKQGEYIGPIGILAVIASLYFNEMKTDFNVIECGKGARFDDVAQLRAELSLVNSIFLEHTEELGATIAEIAYHKAGIIRSCQRGVFLGIQPYNEVNEIVYNEARLHNVPLFSYGDDFEAQKIRTDVSSTSFLYKGRQLEISLCGEHQAHNAATAIAAAEYLLNSEIDSEILKHALLKLKWPGRLDIIHQNPLVILDGCINRMSAEYVAKYFESTDKIPDIVLISIPDDKDSEGVIDTLKPYIRKLIVTIANNPNLKYSKNLQYSHAKKILGEDIVDFIENSDEAISYALSKTKDMLCILGTISFIRDAMVFDNRTT